jgi:hypothetical protein
MITDEEIKEFCEADTSSKIKVAWLGHATTIINFENCIILMDPVFSERYFLMIKTILFIQIYQYVFVKDVRHHN